MARTVTIVTFVVLLGSPPLFAQQIGETAAASTGLPLGMRGLIASSGVYDRAVRSGVPTFGLSSALRVRQSVSNSSAKPGWAQRHPVATGALMGLGAGFLLGAATTKGDIDPVFMGLVWGGAGAGAGALIGKALGTP